MVASLAADALLLLPCAFALFLGIVMLVEEPDAVGVVWTVLVSLSAILAVSGIVVNAVGLKKKNNLV